ncbi:HAD-IIA family hydrolase [Proteiniborus sp. MB09-C3]|uniref:HAD-IIA family hydrolase n=1 Tax=Proteiniborus sp. MB09-C3 TaxID=3050072 RepID=UPI0025554459|nr:HAD-IIA family hydrolase [Proteiniborus sp. MB09-C3]WIV12540.1 HAD-IIA family hydrolase [Proteiniborus sp. MB09-C3]
MDLRNKKCFILDMDGTIYLGDKLLKGSKEFLELLNEQNKRYLFVTNNSSKSARDYVKKLKSLGIEANECDVLTSGEATCIYLNMQKPNAKVYVVGTDELLMEFKAHGFNVINGTQILPDYVVLGFDTTLNYMKIWEACNFIRQGIPFIATHPDLNCPIENGGFMPDCGAMIEMFKASTDVLPKIIGKPNKEIVDVIFEKTGLKSEDIAVVGDRLYTDIMIGKNSGITSVLVLSGETRLEDLKESEIDPDIILDSIKDLYEMLL